MTCKDCRKPPPWGWVQALHKEMAMSYASKEHDFDAITEQVISAIVKCQDGRCAILGEVLDFPDDILPLRMTYGKALSHIPLIKQPTLAKTTSYNRWSIDNVIVISRAIKPFYDGTPGWVACMQQLTGIQSKPLPSIGQILNAMHVTRSG